MNQFYGEVNHDVLLMRDNAEFPIRPINRSNIAPHINGVKQASVFFTDAIIRREDDNATSIAGS